MVDIRNLTRVSNARPTEDRFHAMLADAFENAAHLRPMIWD